MVADGPMPPLEETPEEKNMPSQPPLPSHHKHLLIGNIAPGQSQLQITACKWVEQKMFAAYSDLKSPRLAGHHRHD